MGDILVGACSWTDRQLCRERLVSARTVATPKGGLRHYAERLPVVEVDSGYTRCRTPPQQ
ncbi:hypothetical protein GCM10019016_083730 [Streptomyces prasinosporus]|uniref:Uncharacterized protein n=1 Tax=Streptomyces prasinosporus TaxID=68256 RepID=A0ABP6U4P2_9ACTN